MLRTSSSTTSTLRSRSGSSLSCSFSIMRCLASGRSAIIAMQEQRGLVEQALGALHALEHDALGALAQLGLLLGRELAAR